MSDYICKRCSYVFSEENGCEEAFEAEINHELVEGFIRNEDEKCAMMGVSPGTKWKDVPATFKCPQCGALKKDFKARD